MAKARQKHHRHSSAEWFKCHFKNLQNIPTQKHKKLFNSFRSVSLCLMRFVVSGFKTAMLKWLPGTGPNIRKVCHGLPLYLAIPASEGEATGQGRQGLVPAWARLEDQVCLSTWNNGPKWFQTAANSATWSRGRHQNGSLKEKPVRSDTTWSGPKSSFSGATLLCTECSSLKHAGHNQVSREGIYKGYQRTHASSLTWFDPSHHPALHDQDCPNYFSLPF